MALRVIVGILLVVFVTEEFSAFVTVPTRITHAGKQHPTTNGLRMMMGKKGGAQSKKKRGRGGIEDVGVENEAIGMDKKGGAAAEESDGIVPRLVVMDLDYTLWKPELYQMRGAPFTKEKDGKVRDRSGEVIDLFPGVREALLEVHRGHRFRDTKLAIASRTSHERWARQVMGLIELEPGLLMRSVFSFTEIYSGSKVRHFGEIRRNSKVPYEEMIFFDDWDQNCKDVGKLGVTCVECRRGLIREVWTRGLAKFAAAKESLRS
ncbi:unnamed protein product [Ectocarpus sp. CCAP 1310/34]|nr:unnamed protein product [Ectocarpus sp. CCAP 1310/34]